MKKKLMIAVSMLGLIVVLGSGCVVYPVGAVHGPGITVRYHAVSGRRVLVVPRSVRPGQAIIISGNRCVVHSVRSNRIHVAYPDGRRVWIHCQYR